jgi:hypothetical protein
MAPPGRANEIARRDGNDAPGRLDLARVEVSHKSERVHAFTITTKQPFSSADIAYPDSNFAVSFDLDDRNPSDSRWRYEFWMYASVHRGRLAGSVFNPRSRRYVTRRLTVTRPTPRSIRILLPISRIGGPENYRFAAWSYSEDRPCTTQDPCVDVVPNHIPLVLHDFTEPAASLMAPQRSTDESTTLEFPVSFEVSDEMFGSGLDRWVLETRTAGSTSWVRVATGRASGSFDRVVTGVQGALMETRLVATDRHGNSQTRVRGTLVPYDDTDPAGGLTIAYGGPGGSADWSAVTSIGTAFLGTAHSTVVSGATVEFSFTGVGFCLIGGGRTRPRSTAWGRRSPSVTRGSILDHIRSC